MKDLNIKFNANAIDGSLTTLSGRNVIIQSISNIIRTMTTERIYKPEIGSGIMNLLGENMSAVNASLIVEQIKQTIALYEPRAEIIDITYKLDAEKQTYKLKITYNIMNETDIIEQNIDLKKIN